MKAKIIYEGKPSSSLVGISDRLRELEQRYKNRAEATEAFNVNRSAFDKWVASKAMPSLEAVAKIAKVANVSLDWLAFGTNAGLTTSDDYAAGVEPPDNYDWMKEILDLLGDVYRFTGHNPPPDSYVHEAADIYMNVLSWEKSEDRNRAISLAIASLAPHIKPPEAAPETVEDKRSA